MQTLTVFTLGYSGWKPEEVLRIAEQFDVIVADVRYRPFSRDAQWLKPSLQKLLGDRYVHIAGFGNKNYKSDGPTILADPDTGMRVAEALMKVRPLILMCACFSYRTCHRSDVAAYIAEKTGRPIRHLTKSDLRDDPPQFDPTQLTLV